MYPILLEVTPSPTPTPNINGVLTQGTSLFAWVFECLGSVVTTILAHPILLIGSLIMLVGLVVGICRRLMNLS